MNQITGRQNRPCRLLTENRKYCFVARGKSLSPSFFRIEPKGKSLRENRFIGKNNGKIGNPKRRKCNVSLKLE